jgi:hypothetical protein
MPLEGHWDRLNTPLRETTSRERRILRVVVALVAAAALASVIVAVATSGSGGSATAARCVDLDVPSTMGGSTIHACGADAVAFCRSPLANKPPLAEAAQARCREAGYSVTPQ